MTARRLVPALLACSVLPHAVVYAGDGPTTADAASGSYHFTTPQTPQSMEEAVNVVRIIGGGSLREPSTKASAEISTATLTFSGSVEGVAFTEWMLPQIDKTTGDGALHEYRLPSGDVARVVFVPNATKPPDMQELLTILRTVSDVQKIYAINSNRALVVRAPEWQVLFSQWIIDQLNQPAGQKPDTTPREFMVGGPDSRGNEHGARLNFLASMTTPQQTQELITVLRTVGQVQKVFSYTSGHALVMRAGDVDLQRAEWLIQQLDLPTGHPAGTGTFTASTGDDVTRIFPVPNANSQWIQGALNSMRTELNIKKTFPTTTPANVIVRGTADQIAAAAKWMALHNALGE
jgi:hypothetical protein